MKCNMASPPACEVGHNDSSRKGHAASSAFARRSLNLGPHRRSVSDALPKAHRHRMDLLDTWLVLLVLAPLHRARSAQQVLSACGIPRFQFPVVDHHPASVPTRWWREPRRMCQRADSVSSS